MSDHVSLLQDLEKEGEFEAVAVIKDLEQRITELERTNKKLRIVLVQYEQKIDRLTDELRQHATKEDNKPVCTTCHGTGQICAGSSLSESDGYAPVVEPCPECGG